MKRPQHGFDRSGSHSAGHYVCDCGYEDCSEPDDIWMEWAEYKIQELEAQLNRAKLLPARWRERLVKPNHDPVLMHCANELERELLEDNGVTEEQKT